jgi:hypothetical protein
MKAREVMMANRSYLYSTNHVPAPDLEEDERRMMGISEWNYDIPIAFKILLSGNPKKCHSSIFEMPEEIALVGEYDEGTSRLLQFLDRIPHPAIGPLKQEAREFLALEKCKRRYFVLECGEIFEMEEAPLAEQTHHLLGEIQNLGPSMEMAIAKVRGIEQSESKPPGFFARLFGAKPAVPKKKDNPDDALYALGLGNWSNILYFDLRNE